MKKLIVDQNRCIGCGACVAIDSEHFDFDENGLSHVIKEDNLETEELNTIIQNLIDKQLFPLCLDKNGNHVFQKIIRLYPKVESM